MQGYYVGLMNNQVLS